VNVYIWGDTLVREVDVPSPTYKDPVRVATTAALPANVFDPVAGTITYNAVGIIAAIDTIVLDQDDDLLVKDEGGGTDPANGLYTVLVRGDGATAPVLLRRLDSNTDGDFRAGMIVPVSEGALPPLGNQDQVFILATNDDIIINTTPLTFVNWGAVMPLVTAAVRGEVNPLGAANTVLTTDGATAGGAWNQIVDAYVAAGAAIAGTKIAPDFGAQDVVTTGAVLIDLGATYMRIGLVAGSGAGSAAAAGGLRMQGNGAVEGRIAFRDAVDGADVAGLSCLAADVLSVGGLYPVRPTTIVVDATTEVDLALAGTNQLAVVAASATLTPITLQWAKDTVAPVLTQAGETAAATPGDDLTVGAQGVSNATPANAMRAGNLGLRGGIATGDASNLDGNVWVHVACADWKSMEKGLWLADCVTAPTATQAGGSFFWSASGVLATHSDFAFGALPALTGRLRLQDTDRIVFKAGAGDAAGMTYVHASTMLTVGGAFPTRPATTMVDATTEVDLAIGGASQLAVVAATTTLTPATLQWGKDVVAPVCTQAVETADLAGDLLTIGAQGCSNVAGTKASGDTLVRGGLGTNGNKQGNVAIGAAPASWDGLQRGIFIADAAAVPAGDPANGAWLYSNAGALTLWGDGGAKLVVEAQSDFTGAVTSTSTITPALHSESNVVAMQMFT